MYIVDRKKGFFIKKINQRKKGIYRNKKKMFRDKFCQNPSFCQS